MPVLNEDELSARLHQAMTGLHVSPGLAATVRRRQARRQRVLIAGVTGSVAAALVVGGAVTLTQPAAVPAVSAGPTTAAGPAMVDVAYVVDRTSAALAKAEDEYVVKQRDVAVSNGPGTVDTNTYVYWTDATTKGRHAERLGTDGKVLFTAVFQAGGDGITTDQSAKTWWPEKFGPIGKVTPTRGFREPAGVTDPASLKKGQESGTLKLIGTETVNGAQTLHLSIANMPDGAHKDVWVDSKTYLPAKWVTDVKPGATWTQEYSYLPRTPENLAPFEIKPPAGFTQIPPPKPEI